MPGSKQMESPVLTKVRASACVSGVGGWVDGCMARVESNCDCAARECKCLSLSQACNSLGACRSFMRWPGAALRRCLFCNHECALMPDVDALDAHSILRCQPAPAAGCEGCERCATCFRSG
jgi:hypothetical protein